MRTVLDLPEQALDRSERSFVDNVRDYGWFCTGVGAGAHTPPFSYSTGIWLTTQRPECIIFGLDNAVAHQVLWDVFKDAKGGQDIPVGRRTGSIFFRLMMGFGVMA